MSYADRYRVASAELGGCALAWIGEGTHPPLSPNTLRPKDADAELLCGCLPWEPHGPACTGEGLA